MRGLERGLERAIGNITVAAYVEIEAFIIFNLVRQMEQGVVDAAPIWADIKTFPARQFHGKINGIIGGYPCQPFSYAGKRTGENHDSHIWPFICRDIDIIRPDWCFFENVPGHLSLGYREVRQSLEEMGYTVREGIYSAEEVGAPHQRKRLFILAMDNAVREQIIGNNAGGLHQMFSGTSTEMADTDVKRLQGWGCAKLSERAFKFPAGSGSSQAWPAGQGAQQYDGEEPRTVEPGVGCTVNGYNFRTDLLRMYGNGVVEQTACLAFLDLLRKHLED
jgi:DNA (cytosine-5)-methyltransferase 1